MNRKLRSLLVVVVTVLLADALVAASWAGGVWLADHASPWVSWALGIPLLFALPLLVAVVGYALLGFREGPEAVPAAILAILLMMASPSGAARAVTPHDVCPARFGDPPEEWKYCEFLCFSTVDAREEDAVEYTTSHRSSSGGTTYSEHRYVPLAASSAPAGAYAAWAEEDDSEGKCLWKELNRKAQKAVRASPRAHPAAVVGERVDDPAAALLRFRLWIGAAAGLANVLALVGGAALCLRRR